MSESNNQALKPNPTNAYQSPPQSNPVHWDWPKLSMAIQRGTGKPEFLLEVEQEMTNHADHLQAHRNQEYVDDHWAAILDILQRLAKKALNESTRMSQINLKELTQTK